MTKQRAVWGAGAILAALLFLGGAEVVRGEEEQAFTPIPVIQGLKLLEKGTPAPTFVVKDIQGNDFDFSAARTQKTHLIIFWSIFCEPCREEMPIVEKVYNEFKKRNLEVIAVNLDGAPFLEGIKGFMKQYGYSFNVLIDELAGEQFKVADPYQVAGTPVLYLIDDKGMVAAGHLGRITEEDLRDLVSAVLGEG